MTPAQLKALDYIRDLSSAGITPTMREIATRLDLSGPSGAKRVVDCLVDSGHLTRRPGRTRGLEIAGQPDLRVVPTEAMIAELGRRGKSLDALRGGPRTNMGRYVATCAADCCQIEVRRGHLFCRQHWFSLPDSLQKRILAAFGADDGDAYELAITEARDRIDGSYFQRRDVRERG